jgi:hypoxanthine phosphoribosyltransferase
MTLLATGREQLSVTHSYIDPKTDETETLTFDEFIPEDVIDERIHEMAVHLAPLFVERPRNVVTVPLMAGGSQIMDTILMEISALEPSIAPRIAPIKLLSYDGTERKKVVIEQDARSGIFTDEDVFIFDEVVDGGDTMCLVVNGRVAPEHPRSITVVTLVRKPDAHKGKNVQADVVGFDTPPVFLLGRGMDWHHIGRYQRWIGRVRDGTEAEYTKPPFPAHLLGSAALLG